MNKKTTPRNKTFLLKLKTLVRTVRIQVSGSKKAYLEPNSSTGTGSIATRAVTLRQKLPWTKRQQRKLRELSQKEWHAICHTFLDFPEILENKAAGAKLFLLVLLAQVEDLLMVSSTDAPTISTNAPIIQLGPVPACPEVLYSLLNTVQGPTTWQGGHWSIKRPWVLAAQKTSSFTSPSCFPIDYIGGYWKKKGGKNRRFWAPYVSCAFVISANVPDNVSREIINQSSLAYPILCGQSPKFASRPVISLEKCDFTSVDRERLNLFRTSADNESAYLMMVLFFRAFRKKFKKGKVTLNGSRYIPMHTNGRYTRPSSSPTELILALGMELLGHFLTFAVDEGWLLESDCDRYKAYYWSLALPASAPESSSRTQEGQWKDPETFWRFLCDHLEYVSLTGPDETRTLQTEAAVFKLSGKESYLVLPGDACLNAYRIWLDTSGIPSGEVKTLDVSGAQKALQAGIPFKKESNSVYWRYGFYPKNLVPGGQDNKIPCFGVRLRDLPPGVLDVLRKRLGNAVEQLLSSRNTATGMLGNEFGSTSSGVVSTDSCEKISEVNFDKNGGE